MHVNEKMMQQMAALRRQQSEVGYVIAAIRERGDPLAASLDEELLRREVVATLAACHRLGLRSDADRLSFCLLEITTFAGLRDLPKLQGLLNYAGGGPDDKMMTMLQAMPPPVGRRSRRTPPRFGASEAWNERAPERMRAGHEAGSHGGFAGAVR